MAGTSTIKIEQIVTEAGLNGDIAPVLANGGVSLQPALSIANQVLVAILNGGVLTQPMPWKWNRFYPLGMQGGAGFITNSFQQDYATNNLNIAWLENAQAIDVNNTAVPKPCQPVRVVKDLTLTYVQTGYPGQVCWLYNYELQYGKWGATAASNTFGLSNPGPNVVITNPVGASSTPSNPITQIIDPNGNYWVVTTYGTCGATQPSWPSTPTVPTLSAPNAVASTIADGTVTWTAVNPSAQGFRLSPIPPQTGKVWLVFVVAQANPIQYTSLENYMTPVPDVFYTHFLNGFTAFCYNKATDPKIRAKFEPAYRLWSQTLDNAIRAGNRETDDFRFVPEESIMGNGWCFGPRPDFPYTSTWGF